MADIPISVSVDQDGAIAGFSSIQAAGQQMATRLQVAGQSVTNIGQQAANGISRPIIGGLQAATKAAMTFESNLSNASRALDFTTKETEEFGKMALETAPKLGLLPTKFAEIATESGKLGVAKKDIKEFAEVVAYGATATDTASTELASKTATIRAIFGGSIQDMKVFLAATNAVDDAVGGVSKELLEYTARAGASAKLLGMSASDTVALGGAFAKLGIQTERAATATNNMFRVLADPKTMGFSGTAKGLAAIGMSVEQVQAAMRANPKTGILTVLERITALPKADQLSVTSQIFGKESGDELATLLTALPELKRAFDVAGNSNKNLQKLQDEFNKRMGTSTGQIGTFQANMERLSITVGRAILPGLNMLLSALIPVIDQFARFAEANPQIVSVGIAILGVVAVIGPFLIFVGSAISAIGAIGTIAPVAAGSLGFLSSAVGAVAAFFGMTISPAIAVIAILTAVGVAVGYVAGHFDELPGAIGNAVDNALSLLGNFLSFILTIPGQAAQMAVDLGFQVGQALAQLPQMAWNAGVGLANSLGQGILDAASFVYESVAYLVGTVRQYLPFSPARIGALSDIDKSGAAMMQTFADSITPSPVLEKLDPTFGNIRASMDQQFNNVPIPATAGNQGNLTVNFSPSFTFGSGSNSNVKNDVMETLKAYERDLLTIIDNARRRWNRGAF